MLGRAGLRSGSHALQHCCRPHRGARHGSFTTCLNAAMSTSGYTTLAQAVQMTTDVKKSKFITTAWPASDTALAMDLIQKASLPDATHNCWAYRIQGQSRSSDDGEPSGTAGRPILTAIETEGLDCVCVLVTRYFGGIKLGTGGLSRAYGSAAREALRAAPRTFLKCKVQLELELPYRSLGVVYATLDRCHAQRLGDELYLDDGNVRVLVAVDADSQADFVARVQDATAGAVTPHPPALTTS